jgi:type VI secretion system secreted protein VgrG
VRAGQGLYVSTHAKSATSQQLDAREANSQLVNSESVLEAMSNASTTHQAESLKDGHDALKSFTDATQNSVSGSSSGGKTAGGGTGNANAFKEPVMLFASPSGIALSTQKSAHVSADQHINVVSGQSTYIATGKSLIASIAEKLSLFVQNAGMKLFAAKGKVEIQAHLDNIELTSQKTLKLLSATESIEAAAKQEILLTSGGAYIRVKGGNIEIHAPGKIDIKGGQHSFAGPTQMSTAIPAMPGVEGNYDQAFIAHWAGTDIPAANTPYQIFSDGTLISQGVTNERGETALTQSHIPKDVVVKFLENH